MRKPLSDNELELNHVRLRQATVERDFTDFTDDTAERSTTMRLDFQFSGFQLSAFPISAFVLLLLSFRRLLQK
jgi:nucleosome binding factor SPN SPT16 subunit